jgi:tellurite resistance protein
MYGGSLRPADPRRYLIEAIVGAMQADGVVNKEELAVLEANLQEHEMFSGLSADVTRTLVEMANDSIALAGGPLRRIPYLAKGLPSRSHRMAAYAVASEIAMADGESPEEREYLNQMQRAFLIADEDAYVIYQAAQKRQGMREVEEMTRHLQGLMPFYLESMALMACADGTITAAERAAVRGVLKSVGDMQVLGDRELESSVEAAFRRIEGKDPDACLKNIRRALETPSDRYWAIVYMGIIAVADGYTQWRQIWLLGSGQEYFQLTDDQMDRAMETARLFPIRKES